MCTVAESKKKKKKLFGWLIKIIHLPFFFSFFLFSFFHASLSLSLKLTLSTPVTDPRSSTQAHSLNSGLTLLTPITDPQSSLLIGVPDWETHGACC